MKGCPSSRAPPPCLPPFCRGVQESTQCRFGLFLGCAEPTPGELASTPEGVGTLGLYTSPPAPVTVLRRWERDYFFPSEIGRVSWQTGFAVFLSRQIRPGDALCDDALLESSRPRR